MKKDKMEIVLLVFTIIFAVCASIFYYQSEQPVIISEIPYTEVGSTNYKVHLSDKTYYDKEYLDEGMQYISSIIDYIDIDFKYNAKYDNVSDYIINKNITANIIMTDNDDNDKIIYAKSETLKDENITNNELDFNDNLKVDYLKYNNLVNEIKTKYGISANAKLVIDYRLNYSSKSSKLSDAKKLSIEIPLSKQMISITKGENINESSVYSVKTNKSMFNTIMKICMTIMALLGITCFSVLILRVRDRIKKESAYDRFINRVLKEYDSYITEAKEESVLPDKNIIKIDSFKELLDVRNNIDKTIVYTKIDDNTSKFQIIDEEIYEYVAKRKDMD